MLISIFNVMALVGAYKKHAGAGETGAGQAKGRAASDTDKEGAAGEDCAYVKQTI